MMERFIEKIHISFENCDSVTIPHDAIYSIRFSTDRTVEDSGYRTVFSGHVSLCIDLSKIGDITWVNRKDITHLHIFYTTGQDQYVEVPYPMHYCCWRPNPYQDNYFWERETDHGTFQMLDIDIEPYWSILSIARTVHDWLQYFFSDKLTGARILFGGYWATFKRHFKWRD